MSESPLDSKVLKWNGLLSCRYSKEERAQNASVSEHCRLDCVSAQVDAGAEVILTQPPLLKGQFEAWYDGLSR